MKLALPKDSASLTTYIMLRNTVGTAYTGMAASGMTAYYVRGRGIANAITLTAVAVTGAWVSGGFVEVAATNVPGIYRFDIPDACIATGADAARTCVIMLKSALTAPCALEIQVGDSPAQVNVVSANAITSGAIQAGAITSGSITDGAITNAKVADDLDVNVKTMTTGVITSAALSSGAITSIQAGLALETSLGALATPSSILDATITGTYTLKQLMRVTAAVLGGKVSGADSNDQIFRDISDTKDVVVATTDSYGNRILVTIDPT